MTHDEKSSKSPEFVKIDELWIVSSLTGVSSNEVDGVKTGVIVTELAKKSWAAIVTKKCYKNGWTTDPGGTSVGG